MLTAVHLPMSRLGYCASSAALLLCLVPVNIGMILSFNAADSKSPLSRRGGALVAYLYAKEIPQGPKGFASQKERW